MRKLLIALFVALAAVSASAQKIGSYTLATTLGPMSYDLSLQLRSNGSYMLLIDVPADEGKNARLAIRSKDIPKFKKYLNEMLEKCMDWKLTAIRNNVDDFGKRIKSVKSPGVRVFYNYGSETWLSRDEPMMALFSYAKQIQSASLTLLLDGVAYDNAFICAKVNIQFLGLEGLDELINAIDVEKIENAAKQKQATDDLFQ